jgi:hypothetical protein
MEDVPCDEMKQARLWRVYNFELHIFYLVKINFGQNMCTSASVEKDKTRN